MDIRLGATLEGPNGTTITIDSLLGQGGFGQVFRGCLQDGTRVAVKTVLTSSLSGSELKVLQNEAAHAIGISHPNVVRAIHFSNGEDASGNPPFLVMEFVDGSNLREVIEAHRASNTKPSIPELRAMYLQIAQGMQAINERLVHRDLKPENILVDGATKELKIADFGLAKVVDAATRSETFKGWGTRPYQAPEAFEHGPNTMAMDMYSAGITFFELAALTWPIQPRAGDNSPLAWRNAHLLTPPANVRLARPDLPDSLVQLITLMLQKDPARRPSSWQTVIDRLRREAAPGGTGPDVSSLVQKATTTLLETTARQSKERSEREARAERHMLLEAAFREPVDILRSIVDTFNDATDVGKLAVVELSPLAVEVRGGTRGARLQLLASVIDDLDTRYNGIYRIIGVARIEPVPPAPSEEEALRDRGSFGSFNITYRVQRAADRFGSWNLFRFEHSPLTGRASYPRWFAMDLGDLPRQLQVLNAMGIYQHERRVLDHTWFELLLQHLL